MGRKPKANIPVTPKFKIGDTITDGQKTIVFTNYNERNDWYMGYIPHTGLMLTLQGGDKLQKI